MSSTIRYSKSPVDNSMRLQIKNGIDGVALAEILKSEYDLLWLYSGNFEIMASTGLSNLKVDKIRLQSTESQDVSWISGLNELESIAINGKIKGKIDFSRLKRLKSCELDWCAATKSIITSELPLQRLSLSKFSGSLYDFCDKTLASVATLGLTGGIETLDSISRFKNLNSLSLWNMKKLRDISGLTTCNQLKTLQIESCNLLEYEKVLQRIDTLEKLYFENKVLSSLNVFPTKNLEYIRLGAGTFIEDGDVEVALNFPKLESMSFPKRKGYKYSAEQLNKLLADR